ncbi:hypothetical protein C8Q79DRAFT_793134 [Trametes meyenii]|nr:hypothetical protein C8Q79DRAFT_793134 [Trametes meyenii]
MLRGERACGGQRADQTETGEFSDGLIKRTRAEAWQGRVAMGTPGRRCMCFRRAIDRARTRCSTVVARSESTYGIRRDPGGRPERSTEENKARSLFTFTYIGEGSELKMGTRERERVRAAIGQDKYRTGDRKTSRGVDPEDRVAGQGRPPECVGPEFGLASRADERAAPRRRTYARTRSRRLKSADVQWVRAGRGPARLGRMVRLAFKADGGEGSGRGARGEHSRVGGR